jgi:hypothetical protein
MAYLNNAEITVDAILTKNGREKLAAGEGLNVSKFALGDDEVDYTLYEPAHPKGSAYYDSAIKAIPITEASPDETQVLKYKLVTLPKGTTKMPKVEFGIPSVSVNQNSGKVQLSPTTSPSGNGQSGYTMILANKNAGSIVGEGLSAGAGSTPAFLGDEITATASIETGLNFVFIPNPNITATVKTTITVYGNETGGSQSIPVTISYIQPT